MLKVWQEQGSPLGVAYSGSVSKCCLVGEHCVRPCSGSRGVVVGVLLALSGQGPERPNAIHRTPHRHHH